MLQLESLGTHAWGPQALCLGNGPASLCEQRGQPEAPAEGDVILLLVTLQHGSGAQQVAAFVGLFCGLEAVCGTCHEVSNCACRSFKPS